MSKRELTTVSINDLARASGGSRPRTWSEFGSELDDNVTKRAGQGSLVGGTSAGMLGLAVGGPAGMAACAAAGAIGGTIGGAEIGVLETLLRGRTKP